MFALKSEITIGNFRFSGVNEVRINGSLHSIVETAIIKIPSIAKIIKDGKVLMDKSVTGTQFNDGDPVVIKLGYSNSGNTNSGNDLQTEFTGFVKRRNLDLPLEVECEGYNYLLKRNTVSNFWKSIGITEFLKEAVANIDSRYKVDVKCDLDFVFKNIDANNITGFEMINNLSKCTDGTLSCFFKEPGVLWCGQVYTHYSKGNDVLGARQNTSLKYRLGYNAIKDNGLKHKLATNDPVEVRYSKRLQTGDIVFGNSNMFGNTTRTHCRVLNHIDDSSVLKSMANEKAAQFNYVGYEGYLTGFLQPFVKVGDSVYIEDERYSEQKGVYLVEGTEVVFGVNGARRILEVGPKLGSIDN